MTPYQSMRKCTYPGCHVLVKHGKCPEHTTVFMRKPNIKRLYNSPQWQSMRNTQLAKDPWCADCLKHGEHVPATDVDHVVPHHGDPVLFFDETNLQSLCQSDHSIKTRKEGSTPPVEKV